MALGWAKLAMPVLVQDVLTYSSEAGKYAKRVFMRVELIGWVNGGKLRA